MYTPYDIGLAGEGAVVGWFRTNGWTIIKWDTKSPGATDIETQLGQKKALTQVKSTIFPSEPFGLLTDEEKAIKSRALRLGAEAWEAMVRLDGNLKPLGIRWRQL